MTANSTGDLGFVAVIGLLGVGLYGLLAMRNLIRLIIALQILVKGAVLALVVAGKATGQTNLGQSLAATVIMADTVVAVIGLALAVQVKRQIGTLDVGVLSRLRE
jgi:NADH:ubiquinone oxidoreductase subunit K